jgi:hypothetical protein
MSLGGSLEPGGGLSGGSLEPGAGRGARGAALEHIGRGPHMYEMS